METKYNPTEEDIIYVMENNGYELTKEEIKEVELRLLKNFDFSEYNNYILELIMTMKGDI